MKKNLLAFAAFLLFITATFAQDADATPKSPEFKAKYDKLMALTLDYYKSPVYRTYTFYIELFSIKIDMDKNKKELYSNADWDVWAKQNIAKTNFKDEADIDRSWKELNDAQTAAMAEKKEYFDYQLEIAMSGEGVELLTGVTMDLMEQHPELFDNPGNEIIRNIFKKM